MLRLQTCPAGWPEARLDLSGRTVLLTGAGGGLGQTFALAAARAGADVILAGRRVAALERLYDTIEGEGGRAAIYPVNLAGAGPADYAELAERVHAQHGGLDALVFASAHMRGLSPIERTPPEDWLTALHVNLSAPFLLTQACLPLLKARSDSAIVFAVNGPETTAHAYWGGYGVAQAGLLQLAAILADELENTPVRVHAFDPGPMRTGLRQGIWFAEDPATVPTPERAADVLVGLAAPLGRPYRATLLQLS